MGAAYGQQLAYDLGGGVNDKSTLLAYRDEHLSDARNILGNQEVSASFLYSHVNGLRNLADFGLTAAEEYQLADSLWRSYTANSMYRKLTKKSGLGSIVKVVASSVISFAATSVLGPIGGALVSTLASGGDLGGFGSALVGGAVGAFIGSGVSQAFGEAIKTTGGQFAASVLGGGITAEVLGGDFASGAIGGAIGFGIGKLSQLGSAAHDLDAPAPKDEYIKAEKLSIDLQSVADKVNARTAVTGNEAGAYYGTESDGSFGIRMFPDGKATPGYILLPAQLKVWATGKYKGLKVDGWMHSHPEIKGGNFIYPPSGADIHVSNFINKPGYALAPEANYYFEYK